MPYNGARVKRDKEALAQAMINAMFEPLEYGSPMQGPMRVTSPFGMRDHPVTGQRKMHTGVDIAVPVGTPVFATEDGVLSAAMTAPGAGPGGMQVRLKHADGRETRYEHLSKFAPAALRGGRIRKGELLGYSGNTGTSTGPHLHYGMYQGPKPRDPFG